MEVQEVQDNLSEFDLIINEIDKIYKTLLNPYEDLDRLLFQLYQDFPNERPTPKLLHIIDDFLSSEYSTKASSIINDIEEYLELDKKEGFYHDIYNRRVSYDSIRTLKKPHTELPLKLGHACEIYKCSHSFKYFRANYIKIKTKKGIKRPEPRKYQERLEDDLANYENLVLLWPRQSGKSVTIGIWALHNIMFKENYIAGVAANIQKLAIEYLDKIKKAYLLLPIWLQSGIESWNKQEIEFENGSKFLTSATNSDAFRGFTTNLIIGDETAFTSKLQFEDFVDAVTPAQAELDDKQFILTSTANGKNHFYYECINAKPQYKEAVLNAEDEVQLDGKLIKVKDLYELSITDEFKESFNESFKRII